MPNWCSNTLTISHEDQTKVDALEAELLKRDDAEILNHIRPRPLTEEENWYNWNINNWGTKWDISPWDWDRNGNTIIMNFDSAWSPPIIIYDFMHEEGWNVHALYHEPGMGFIGCYEDGIDNYYDYDLSDRESIESLPEELIEYGALLEEHDRWAEENSEEE